MIEKFTKEELEIIKKELKELPKNKQKRDVCFDDFIKLKYAFYKQDNYDGISLRYDFENFILAIADCTLCNYEQNPNKKDKYKRSAYVNKSIINEYKQFVHELVELVCKNLKTHIEEESE